MVKIFATILVLFAFYHTGLSLKCYACNSNSVPGCADPPNTRSINLHDCHLDKNSAPGNVVSCMKIVTEDTSNAKTNVTRKCMTHPQGTDPCNKPVPDLKPSFKVNSCDSCDTDACNKATISGISIFPVFTILIVICANIFFKA